jgi:hypothetical protein
MFEWFFTSLLAEMEAFLRICMSALPPSATDAGMSAVGRWVFGRGTGDLPLEVISEISTAAQPAAGTVLWGLERFK